ncbi:protein translocase subunit SecF [Roseinatronobacter alkalisoli]|uniref:Protein-export membrane protein SecF n=1 Tax=Roseinatronobacter alkalisoli TaxID=3028235 RepID=A0ABT5T821_9RHOB|nr:protein translocase subunit SecF [Roseinatronobacter sp. HJB301]MDD7971278.1 protein translocase subunit SecF [Roseinatronobacter sp. HJB301]
MRLKLVPQDTNVDFFRYWKMTFGASILAMVLSVAAFLVMGLNFGIDFRGGTSIRTEAQAPVDIAAYRGAIAELGFGDVAITEVFDPAFATDRNVAMVRIQAQEGVEAITPEQISAVRDALQSLDPSLTFAAVDSVGPKVSGELIRSAVISVVLALAAVLFYIWLRFEWQFSVGAVAALVHDVVLTIGVFSILQIRFDLAIIAALLTIVGYSLNDTVVVFDRVRENLIKFKKRPLKEVLNLSINDTLSRTVMTSVTTLLALLALFILGGDVIRGFVFAMIWGVIVGTYSSVFVASAVLLRLGVKRDWSKNAGDSAGTQFGVKEG